MPTATLICVSSSLADPMKFMGRKYSGWQVCINRCVQSCQNNN